MRSISTKTFVLAGIVVALFLAFMISPYASSSPDGLEKVATDTSIDVGVDGHAMADSPLADYSVNGVDGTKLSTGLAGIAGVGVTFALGFGLFALVRAGRRARASQSAMAP
jgi:cobalt/nickel transport system permease protein